MARNTTWADTRQHTRHCTMNAVMRDTHTMSYIETARPEGHTRAHRHDASTPGTVILWDKFADTMRLLLGH